MEGYNAIVVYIDHYSKQVYVILTTSEVDTEGIMDIHYHEVFRLHGIPSKVVSMKALYYKLGIVHVLTTTYHPQSNGQTERANQEVKQHL